jgi:hypothetical protein
MYLAHALPLSDYALLEVSAHVNLAHLTFLRPSFFSPSSFFFHPRTMKAPLMESSSTQCFALILLHRGF